MPKLKGGGQSAKGNLNPRVQQLAKEGKRVRYNGFWLGPSPMERAIAEGIEEMGTDAASKLMKLLFWKFVTGKIILAGEGEYVPDKKTSTKAPKSRGALALLDMDD